jgi:hypothetical protein
VGGEQVGLLKAVDGRIATAEDGLQVREKICAA